MIYLAAGIGFKTASSRSAETTQMRSFATSFSIPIFCHSFMFSAEELLSLGSTRSPAS